MKALWRLLECHVPWNDPLTVRGYPLSREPARLYFSLRQETNAFFSNDSPLNENIFAPKKERGTCTKISSIYPLQRQT